MGVGIAMTEGVDTPPAPVRDDDGSCPPKMCMLNISVENCCILFANNLAAARLLVRRRERNGGAETPMAPIAPLDGSK